MVPVASSTLTGHGATENFRFGERRSLAYPGRIGTVGGGLKKLPPKPMPVPCEGGASPTSGFEPMVRSTSGCAPPKLTPATAPPSPSPTDAEAAASDDGSGPA